MVVVAMLSTGPHPGPINASPLSLAQEARRRPWPSRPGLARSETVSARPAPLISRVHNIRGLDIATPWRLTGAIEPLTPLLRRSHVAPRRVARRRAHQRAAGLASVTL